MARLIRQVIAADGGRPPSFDVVHIEHLRGAVLGAAVEGVPKVYDAVDCISLLFERTWRQAPGWRHRLMAGVDLGRTRRFEGRIVGEMDGVLVSSPEDRDALAKLCLPQFAHRINVIPNGVDLDYFRPADGAEAPTTNGNVVFSGKMSYHANIAAALDLAQTIMPHVWEVCPGVHLTIAGKDPPASLKALERDPRIHVTGTVPDLRPILAGAAVVACPLRYGAGIQNKVLEAMALGRPVVVSAQAAAALNAVPGRDLLLGKDPTEFAQHIIRLLNDPDLRRTVGQAGRRYVEAHHRWDDVAGRLEECYRSF
jgi:glycosyltransferase involved in cell wall biosynthesis